MDLENSKMRSTERTLVLKPIDGKNVLSSSGLVDNRLFKGGNSLKAVMNPIDCLWRFKYETGIIPESLRQKFTSFAALLKFGQQYFERRGLQIVEIID